MSILFHVFQEGVNLSYKVSFDPQGTGAELWEDLYDDGKLNSADGRPLHQLS